MARIGDLKVGDAVVRSNGRVATLVNVEVVAAPEEFRVDGVWMTWSDGLGPFVADPDWELITEAEARERYNSAARERAAESRIEWERSAKVLPLVPPDAEPAGGQEDQGGQPV